MSDADTEICGNCVYGLEVEDDDAGVCIECHRYPPTPFTSIRGNSVFDIVRSSTFPILKADGFCGEFKLIVK